MDVLNTTGGDVDVFLIGFSNVLVGLSIAALVLAVIATVVYRDKEWMAAWVVCAAGLAFMALYASEQSTDPIRHEVTLRPGHVIDATKYEIVEQRGKIYVIEERGAGE